MDTLREPLELRTRVETRVREAIRREAIGQILCTLSRTYSPVL